MLGSFGISISVCCMWMFFYLRYSFIALKVPEIKVVNYSTYLLGCFSALACLGVGAVQWVNNTTLHSICAYVSFFGFNVYLLINTWYIDLKIMKFDSGYKRGLLRCLFSLPGP